jgi:hypothetical protein
MVKAAKELYAILDENLGWKKPRLDCFTKMLMAMFVVKTINLKSISVQFDSDEKIDSRYKRLQRFFRFFIPDFNLIAKFIYKWFNLGNGKHYLIVDRTNWKLGKTNINVLMLSVSYGGISIPLLWMNLGRAGNSNTQQRIDLMDRFIKLFGVTHIAGLLGDREFIGKRWFQYLITNKISLFIRIKYDTKVPNSRGKMISVKKLYSNLKPGQVRVSRKKINLWGSMLYLSAARDLNGLLKVVASEEKPEMTLQIYLIRQEIETLFGCLKTRGFRFEDTHMTDTDRIDKLIVLLAIGFCWSYKVGEWLHDNVEPIKLKSHNRRAVSMFRYGLDFIRNAISKLSRKYKDFKICLSLLKLPDKTEKTVPLEMAA